MTTKEELREQIKLINENRRLLIKDLQESEKARSLHANLNRGVASELGLGCGASWYDLPERVKKLKQQVEILEKNVECANFERWRDAEKELPPHESHGSTWSIDLLLETKDDSLPIVGYYSYISEQWFDFHRCKVIPTESALMWRPMPKGSK